MGTIAESTGVHANDHASFIDKKFLESILRRDDTDDEIVILDVDVQSAVPKGDNYASLLMRVTVEYSTNNQLTNNKNTQKKTLIVKTLPVSELMKNFVTTTGFFDKESHMYKVTLPEIYKLIQDKAGAEVEHLATDTIPLERPNTIVLKDLRPDGYKMADRKSGLDLTHSIKAIRTLAKLHAYSMALYKKDPTTMDFYKETFYIEENTKMLDHFLTTTFENLSIEVGTWKGYERFGEKVKVIATNSVSRTIDLIKHKAGALRVLNHGDFWTNNMMFRYEEENIADIKMVDFQMVRFASPGLDLQYFLHTSPSQNILEENWDLLIEEYHEELSDILKLLEYGEEIPLDFIYRELDDKAYYGVVTSCMFWIMVAEEEDAPDMTLITEENVDTVGASSLNKAFAGKRFRSALERRLLKFEKQGLI